VFSTGQPLTDEISFPSVDGIRNYEYTISLISNINNATDAVVITVKDITDHKQAIAAANEALAKEVELSTLHSHFASIVPHELRNPLNSIACCAQLVEKHSRQWTQEKQLTYLRRIQVDVKRINQLLDDLSLIRNAQARTLELAPALLDITEFCRELVKELQQDAGANHKIIFISQTKRSGIWDEKLLRRILLNLLLDAIKYSPEGSEIKLSVVCEKGKAIFRIQDSGIGIPEQDQALLFKTFQRGSNVDSITGTGLGLSIVKQCVDLHKGEISVESEISVGTTFTVKLPLNHPKFRV
jgi:signal transduction histidine kinase